jgi:hypothetical protein
VNQAPAVNAGTPQSIVLPNPAILNGIVEGTVVVASVSTAAAAPGVSGHFVPENPEFKSGPLWVPESKKKTNGRGILSRLRGRVAAPS